MDYKPFPKIPRWKGTQHCFITEKIDGTNAQIVINEDCTDLRAGSRTRWITPEDDNFGFAGWCERNKEALLTLGKGSHFGEWYGAGIQRTYGLREKHLALFNTQRWAAPEQQARIGAIPNVHTVPVLYTGEFSEEAVDNAMRELVEYGSKVSPFMNPEGIIIYLPGSRSLFKMTFDGNEPKWTQ